MLRSLVRRFGYWVRAAAAREGQPGAPQSHPKLSHSLEDNLHTLQALMGETSDLIIRRFRIGRRDGHHAVLAFINGLVDRKQINQGILQPLMSQAHLPSGAGELIEHLQSSVINIGNVHCQAHWDDILDQLLRGSALLLLDGSVEAVCLDIPGSEKRSVEEPASEVVVRGPREGFVESISVNVALLRGRIRHPGLVFYSMSLGDKTRTKVMIAYFRHLASEEVVNEVKRRLSNIEVDSILESGYIEQYIEDAPLSPFSTVAYSERPDSVAARVLEGRVAILIDGTPLVLTVPHLFVESLQSPEDYYVRPFYASIIRLLRFLALALASIAPAVYVALSSYHQELIPTPLLLTMSAATEGTPFPAIVDVLVMGAIFELLREAGVRLPRPVGQTISIVGALVIGQAAVAAGIVGAPVVIVVAVTAITTFILPNLSEVTLFLRFFLVLLASVFGAIGMTIGLLMILVHLASLRSFGAPYLSPFAPLTVNDLKDTTIRAPLWTMLKRPRVIEWRDPEREESGLRPEPPPAPSKKGHHVKEKRESKR